jgi:hypothetical protein
MKQPASVQRSGTLGGSSRRSATSLNPLWIMWYFATGDVPLEGRAGLEQPAAKVVCSNLAAPTSQDLVWLVQFKLDRIRPSFMGLSHYLGANRLSHWPNCLRPPPTTSRA